MTALQRMLRTSDGLARARRREMARGAAAMMHRGQDSSDESQTEDEDEQQQQQEHAEEEEEEGEETALGRRSRLVRGALFGEVVRSSTGAAGVPGRRRGGGGGEGGGGGGGGAIVIEPLDRTLPARLRDCASRLRLHGASRGSGAHSLEEAEVAAERTVRGGAGTGSGVTAMAADDQGGTLGGAESLVTVASVDGGESYLRVDRVAVPKATRARRVNRRWRRVGARGREQRRGQPRSAGAVALPLPQARGVALAGPDLDLY
eukprot:COSAG01_NODE_1142_length_11533_cov_9.907381_2_plen_261_part_00